MWIALLHFIPAILSLCAIAKMDAEFYRMLRSALSIPAVIVSALSFWEAGGWSWWGITFFAVALIFNPITPNYSDRESWAPINVIVAVLFVTHWVVGFILS